LLNFLEDQVSEPVVLADGTIRDLAEVRDKAINNGDSRGASITLGQRFDSSTNKSRNVSSQSVGCIVVPNGTDLSFKACIESGEHLLKTCADQRLVDTRLKSPHGRSLGARTDALTKLQLARRGERAGEPLQRPSS
jgi:hypothetical protein